jgi:hypothetical protein
MRKILAPQAKDKIGSVKSQRKLSTLYKQKIPLYPAGLFDKNYILKKVSLLPTS